MTKYTNLARAFFTCTALLPVSAMAGEMASGAEIEEMLNGNTLLGAGMKDTFAEYYDPDGTIRGDGYTAKWKVEGDTGCMDYSGEGFKCWTMEVVDGAAHIWYLDGELSAAAMAVPGNPKNF